MGTGTTKLLAVVIVVGIVVAILAMAARRRATRGRSAVRVPRVMASARAAAAGPTAARPT